MKGVKARREKKGQRKENAKKKRWKKGAVKVRRAKKSQRTGVKPVAPLPPPAKALTPPNAPRPAAPGHVFVSALLHFPESGRRPEVGRRKRAETKIWQYEK